MELSEQERQLIELLRESADRGGEFCLQIERVNGNDGAMWEITVSDPRSRTRKKEIRIVGTTFDDAWDKMWNLETSEEEMTD